MSTLVFALALSVAAVFFTQDPVKPAPPAEEVPEVEEFVEVSATRSGKRLEDQPMRVEVRTTRTERGVSRT